MAIPAPRDPAVMRERLQGAPDVARTDQVEAARLRELSMGMSGDYEAAIEEGRRSSSVGTAIFGPRERT